MIRYDLPGLGALLRLTLTNPAEAARWIIAERLGRDVLWLALLLVTVLSVLLAAVTQGTATAIPTGDGVILVTPFAYATILGSSLVMMVFGLYWTGRSLGGTGGFPATLALVVWLEAVAMTVRVAQAIAYALGPQIGGIVSMLGLGLLIWALVNFINVLHGFESLGKSVLTLVLAVIGIGIGITLILTLIGFGTAAAGGL